MCIIAICTKRKLTDEEFENCWSNNSDGAGIAFPTGPDTAKMYKGYMQKDTFKALYDSIMVLPHVVHFRISSSGGVCPELTHPFLCTPNSPYTETYEGSAMLLFHNGIAIDWQTLKSKLSLPIEGKWSDTRVLSAAIGAGKEAAKLLPTAGGKFVTVEGRAIWRYGQFDEEDGVLFSNATYKWARPARTTYIGTRVWHSGWYGDDVFEWDDDDDDVGNGTCPRCQAPLLWNGRCTVCKRFATEEDCPTCKKAVTPAGWCSTCNDFVLHKCPTCGYGVSTFGVWCTKCQKKIPAYEKLPKQTRQRKRRTPLRANRPKADDAVTCRMCHEVLSPSGWCYKCHDYMLQKCSKCGRGMARNARWCYKCQAYTGVSAVTYEEKEDTQEKKEKNDDTKRQDTLDTPTCGCGTSAAAGGVGADTCQHGSSNGLQRRPCQETQCHLWQYDGGRYCLHCTSTRRGGDYAEHALN